MAIFAQLLMTSLTVHYEFTVDDGRVVGAILCLLIETVSERASLTVDDDYIAIAILFSVLRFAATGIAPVLFNACTWMIFISLFSGLPSHYTKNPHRLIFALLVFAMLYM
jgi:hypothetical protein